MKLRSGLLGLFLLALAAWPVRAADLQFSASLSAAQKAEAGLDHLSADQVAVVDALVRRTAPTADQDKTSATALPFSQRLADTERAAAGLDRLSASELSRLNALVVEQTAAEPTKSVPTFKADDWAHRLTVHGSVTLGIAGGHGFSSRFAEGEVEVFDPVTGMRVTIGYGTERGKYTLPAGLDYLRPMPRELQRR